MNMAMTPDRWVKLSEEFFALIEFKADPPAYRKITKLTIMSTKSGYLKKLTIDNNLNRTIEISEDKSLIEFLSRNLERFTSKFDENSILNMTYYILDSTLGFVARNLNKAKKLTDVYGILSISSDETSLLLLGASDYIRIILYFEPNDAIYISFYPKSQKCFLTYESHEPLFSFTENVKFNFESPEFKYLLSLINLVI